ncbi:hypothetical protein CAPTEDRAFT_225348 [Capitella teleta]|uniref:Uncharacterized protein n=1 Tax=Capitella teleta TaxID=283909 RepID=R7U5F9_CAPTE|nr:hypothetical protein CAPTEDRAFT_225348 [Capitella teleta]|eukprot:ELU01209.1 hypothetical protein CAPTEDRAFT_225348 [Capitella teleta]
MLKPTEPNVGAGHRASARSPSPGPKQPSVLDRLWASDKWDKATHESVDQDLDSAAKAGELERILGPLKNFNPQQGAAQPYPHERPSANAPSSFSRLSVRSFRMADGKIEERRSVEDESGRREDTISRSMDGQAYTKITETSPLGSTAVKEDFQNMSPQEREEFEARWKGQVGPGALKIPAEQEALLHNKMSESQQEASRNLKGLFKFNFPGFAFGGKDNR